VKSSEKMAKSENSSRGFLEWKVESHLLHK
jgi:hypothetical protein